MFGSFDAKYKREHEDIVASLKKMREDARLSQAQMADRLSLDIETIEKLELGVVDVTHRQWQGYAYFCDFELKTRIFKNNSNYKLDWVDGKVSLESLATNLSAPFVFDLENLKYIDVSYYSLAKAFRTMADTSVEELVHSEQGRSSNIEFLPIAYAYRHALELALKNLLLHALNVDVISDSDLEKGKKDNTHNILDGHNLNDLVEVACKVLNLRWPNVDQKDKKQVEWMAIFVKIFHELDSDGQHFRYPLSISKKNKFFRKLKVNKLDGLRLKYAFSGVFNMLICSADQLEDDFQYIECF